jgi:2-iminobutanoate/2-iminopropanoate deaminase
MADKTVVHTDQAPRAVGPYSQAIVAGGFVFTSGQIPLSPSTGKLVEGAIDEQTHQVMRNLQAVLSAAGSDLSRVVKTTVFLAEINDFKVVNGIYAGYFADGVPPARSTVQVAALPLGARVEIEVVALA